MEKDQLLKRTINSDVAVIIPTLNEEEGIGPTLKELTEVLDDPYYVVVDGNSLDKTVEIATQFGAKVIVQQGKGKGRAVAQALQHIKSDTRYVIFIDADYTYPAEYIPKMIEILEANPDVGMVTGNRFPRRFAFKALGNVYYLGNRLLAFIQYMVNGLRLRDPLTGLRVIRWVVLKDWDPKSRGFDVETEINYFVGRNGYHLVEVPIPYRRRLGRKKLGLRHGFIILRRILLQRLFARAH